MMEEEGMVAVVKGLRGAGLSVTVVDGNKRFTLMPKSAATGMIPETPQRYIDTGNETAALQCSSGMQAVDGRYASTYQMAHCSLKPTSPLEEVTEFPPQRPNSLPGRGNFQVGGQGSGETNANTDIKKGIGNGYPCSSRISCEMNGFANSLRKYPIVSPEVSSEMIERLVNCLPEKSAFRQSRLRTQQHPTQSPPAGYNADIYRVGRRPPGEPDTNARMRSCAESPTKDKGRTALEFIPHRDNDRSPRVLMKHVATYRKLGQSSSSNFVNTESQAAVKMVSREVATEARPPPSRRTIALPLSPTLSTTKVQGECRCVPSPNTSSNFRLIYSNSFQAIASCQQLDCTSSTIGGNRRSRSQCDIKMVDNNAKSNIFESIKDVIDPETKENVTKGLVNEWEKLDRDEDEISNDGNKIDVIDSLFGSCSHDSTDVPLVASIHELDSILKKNIKKNNIKVRDFQNKCLDRDAIFGSASQKRKRLILNKTISSSNLKSEIVNDIEDLPVKGSFNKKAYVNKLFIFNKTKKPVVQCFNEKHDNAINDLSFLKRRKKTKLTEVDFKTVAKAVMGTFLERSSTKMSDQKLHCIEEAFVVILIDSVDCIRQGNDTHVREEVRDIAKELRHISDLEASCFTKDLIFNLKEILNEGHFYNTTYTILPVPNSVEFPPCWEHKDEDLRVNWDEYTRLLAKQIDKWLNMLNLSLTRDTKLSQMIVNDLAGKIVERYKYLELYPNSNFKGNAELEQLKFEIFKWSNKLIGEGITEAIDHAQELMDVIKNVPFPVMINLYKDKAVITDHCKKRCSKGSNYSDVTKYNVEKELEGSDELNFCENLTASDNNKRVKYKQNMKMSNLGTNDEPPMSQVCPQPQSLEPYSIPPGGYTNKTKKSVREPLMLPRSHCHCHERRRNIGSENICKNPPSVNQPIPIPPCCLAKDRSSVIASVKVLNEEYDNFLQQWLQDIPILATTPEEKKLIGLARLGIYNGIWKAITKLKFDPGVFGNPHYYQDMLDDEVEELFGYLPQTEELEAKKHDLKVELITNTIRINEKIKAAAFPSSFKQQLIENIDHHLPKTSKLTKREELKKNELIEDYILFIRYKDDNDLKGNVHRIKFLKNIEVLADSVKRNHKNEFKDVERHVYINELITAVKKVPLPDTGAVQLVANEILIQNEIDHWLSDLPLKSDLNPADKLRIRDTIANKVYEIEKRLNVAGCAAQVELQYMLPKQLRKLPLKNDADVNFLMEELVSRLKNIAIDAKKVIFQPSNYEEFAKDMPACSSFHESTETSDLSSRKIIEGEVVQEPAPKNWPVSKETTVPDNLWFSMDQAKPPSGMFNWSQEPLKSDTGPCRKPECGTDNWPVSKETTVPDNLCLPMDQTKLPPGMLDRSQKPFKSDTGPCKEPQCGAMSMPQSQTPMEASKWALSNDQTSTQLPYIPSCTCMPTTDQKPNRQQKMVGQIGILGTSQVGGPSGVNPLYSVNSSKNDTEAKTKQNISVHASIDTDIDHEFCLSIDSAGIKKIIEENLKKNNCAGRGWYWMNNQDKIIGREVVKDKEPQYDVMSMPQSQTIPLEALPSADQRPNRQQKMVGQMGIPGTSQVGGPSGVNPPVKYSVNSSKNGMEPKTKQNISSHASIDTDVDHEFYLSTDSAGIKKRIEENLKKNNYAGCECYSMNNQDKIKKVNAECMTSNHNKFLGKDCASRCIYSSTEDRFLNPFPAGLPPEYPRYPRIRQPNVSEDDAKMLCSNCRCKIIRSDDDVIATYPERIRK